MAYPAPPLPARPELPLRVRDYLEAVAQACTAPHATSPPTEVGAGLVSLVLFGSAAKGGFHKQVSDVDLIVVLTDTLPEGSREERAQVRAQVRGEVSRLEIEHGFRARGRPRSALEACAERVCGNYLSCFVCTRGDLLSGDVARVFDLNPAEAFFVDRIVLANILASAVTVWGEDLLSKVNSPHVRRLDVWKSCFNFISQVQLCLLAYPLLPYATRYAMGTLKHSLHSCYFCYHGKTAALDEEVAFFQQRLGARQTCQASQTSETLQLLLALREQYRKSFGFVLRCVPALLRLHARTARDNRFPLESSPRR